MVAAGVSPINKALNLIPKRAEYRQAERLRDTFVDSGVAAALEAIDHQVLYGRRGTGKTHALRYIETVAATRGDLGVYVDLRQMGSPEGLFMGEDLPPTERAARLLVDLLSTVHDAFIAAAMERDDLLVDSLFVDRLDALARAISSVRIAGDVERSEETEGKATEKRSGSAKVGLSAKPTAEVGMSDEQSGEARDLARENRKGQERRSLNFSEVAQALRALAESVSGSRIWLLLDEWIAIPAESQPFLAEFIKRTILPLQKFTLKIAAIEQQSRFREQVTEGRYIGIELGADVSANVDLDEFMVFEQNEERARSFFRDLLFKHLTSGGDDEEGELSGLASRDDLVRVAFNDKRAFDELVRAAEGVPRDALNIAGKAALNAGTGVISVPAVRQAARTWFQTDKERAISDNGEAQRLLYWIIDNVIREKRARGFLVNQREADSALLLALFDARVLHVIRRGYSAQDEPGERYDVYIIDYGAYVDLIHTKYEPLGVLALGDEEITSYVDVPTQDLRAIRRAILRLSDFEQPTRRRATGRPLRPLGNFMCPPVQGL